jgi:hypothetical protein
MVGLKGQVEISTAFGVRYQVVTGAAQGGSQGLEPWLPIGNANSDSHLLGKERTGDQ